MYVIMRTISEVQDGNLSQCAVFEPTLELLDRLAGYQARAEAQAFCQA